MKVERIYERSWIMFVKQIYIQILNNKQASAQLVTKEHFLPVNGCASVSILTHENKLKYKGMLAFSQSNFCKCNLIRIYSFSFRKCKINWTLKYDDALYINLKVSKRAAPFRWTLILCQNEIEYLTFKISS